MRPANEERGIIAVLVAVMAVMLVGVLAFVTDFGMAYANQRRVQNGADAAALAVGAKIANGALYSDTCATIASRYNDAATRAFALGVFQKNVAPGATLTTGNPGYQVTCETIGTNPSAIVVNVKGEQASPSFFGGIFGRQTVPVSKPAKVLVGPLATAVGLRPFAICKTIADQVRADTLGTTFVVPVTQANAGCGSAPGNWAMMDFNGGSNPTGDMKDWIQNGYDQPVTVNPPLLIDGDPGFNVNAAQTEMDIMFSLPAVSLPVYSSVTGNGNNSVYTIVGFVSVTPCRYKINNKTGPGTVNAGCAALPASPPSDYLQLKFSSYTPIGDVSASCPVGPTDCGGGPRGWELAD